MTAPTPITFPAYEGITLRGERWGTGPAPVLFTQGNGFCIQSYRDAFAPVAERVTVHALNSRGHGGSDVPPNLDRWDSMVEDLRLYLKAHFSGPILVAGHSMGATIALRLTSESPELVSGLLLMEPNFIRGRADEWPTNNTGIQAQMVETASKRRERWASRAEVSTWLRERGTYKTWAQGPFDAFIESGMVDDGGEVRLACPAWFEARAYATLPNAVMYEWADKLRVPVVLVQAMESQVVSANGLRDFLTAVPICTVLKVKGGHSFPMQHPREAGDAIAMGLDILLRGTQARPKSSQP